MADLLANILKSNLRLFLALALLVLTAYSFMLASPFKTMDDDFSIVKNAEIRRLENIPHFFRSTYFKTEQDYYRPLVYVTYALEYHLFGLNYFHYNLDNVLLHILNAWLVFVLAGLVFASPGAAGWAGQGPPEAGQPRSPSGRALAAAAALLFAVHPVHWEAVGNVSGRAILLCAFFVLAGLIFFLRFFREDRPVFLLAAVVCYVLGLASKESAGVMILTLAAYAALAGRPRAERAEAGKSAGRGAVDLAALRGWAWLLPFGVLAAGYLAFRHAMGISKMFPWPTKTTMALGLATFLKGLFIYGQVLLFPVGLRFDRGLRLFTGFDVPAFWLTLVAWILIGVCLWRFRKRLAGLPFFCLAWFLIELIPVSQIVTTIGVYPGAISLAEHFLYVASVPAFILLAAAGGRLLCRARERGLVSAPVGQAACAGLFLFFYIMLVQQNLYASNEFVMLRDSLAKDPQNARLQYSMGMVYAKAHNYDLAVEHFRKAVEIHGCNYGYNIALGKALTDQGDLLAAARQYESIPPRKSVDELLNGNKRALYRLLVAEYERKAAAAPSDAETRFALGIFYAKTGDQAQALAQYRRAVELKPDHFDAWYNIAVTSEALGEVPSARAAYERLAGSADGRNTFQEKARAALLRLP